MRPFEAKLEVVYNTTARRFSTLSYYKISFSKEMKKITNEFMINEFNITIATFSSSDYSVEIISGEVFDGSF